MEVTVGHSKSFPPDTHTIISYVAKHYAEYEVSLAYEVGCCGYVPARAFTAAGWDSFVVNPADIPRPSKNKFTKTDKIDAKNIAMQLRSSLISCIVIFIGITNALVKV